MCLHSREEFPVALGLEGMDGHEDLGVQCFGEALEVRGTRMAGGMEKLQGDAVGIGPGLEFEA